MCWIGAAPSSSARAWNIASRCGAVVTQHADLDQAVGLERGVDFLLDGRRQAVVADHDDGVEMMRFGAVRLALRRWSVEFGAWRYYLGCSDCQNRSGMKIKTKSKKVNRAWLNDHVNDPYVKLAQKEGYRARAAYKLKEIDETLGLIKPGHLVVDLGSAPGAWSQYVRRKLSPGGRGRGRAERHHHRPGHPAHGAGRGRHVPSGRLPRAGGAGATGSSAWPGARPTSWCRTWRPTCRASNPRTPRASPIWSSWRSNSPAIT